MTILDNRRMELDTRIEWQQEKIDALRARLAEEIEKLRTRRQAEIDRLQVRLAELKAERRELDGYVPAVDPDSREEGRG